MMDRTQTAIAELRRRAESKLSRLVKHAVPDLAPQNIEALVHELRVHQIELEVQCQQLQQAQAETAESRDRYRELYESIPVGYATIDVSGRIYDMNPAGAGLLGMGETKRRLDNFFFFFFNGDVNEVTRFCKNLLVRQESGVRELRMKRIGGMGFIGALEGMPVTVGEGKGERLRMAFQDITHRKTVEDQLRRQQAELESNRNELRELTRKLFTVQEEERKRIARELHDDYCQRVTTLILEANLLRNVCEKEASHLAPRLNRMSHTLSAILSEFRALSHELLPRNLGDTSLGGPIRDLVKEFNGKAGFDVTFFEQEVPAHIPPGTMTTIFRLLQESLSNITKHANATHVAVTLAGTGQGGVELIVVDNGRGFDTASAWDGEKGMGIVGMRERVRLVGGTVKIISQPSQGTTIVFSIPL